MSDQTDPLFLAIEGTRPSLPTDAERERSIAAVLDAALPQRARRGWLGWTLRESPPSLLFFGVEDCLFLATLFAGLCLAPAALAVVQNTPLPALLFLVSPALYLALHLLTTWKESMSGMLEWKRTCRVPLQKVTAVRMFVFGGASVVACVAMSAVLWQLSNRALPFAWMLGVSFSSLFLYAALSLAVQRARRRWALFAVPAAWVVLGAVLLRWEGAATLLLQVPTYVFLLVAFCALLLFLGEVRRLATSRPVEGGFHAVR